MSLFSFMRKRPTTIIDPQLRIVFHRETRGMNMHGHITATHADHGIVEDLVRFTFMGLVEAPRLTPQIMQFIWERAEAAGFIVHDIASYGKVIDATAAIEVSDMLSPSRRAAESRFPHPTTVPAVERVPTQADLQLAAAKNPGIHRQYPNSPSGPMAFGAPLPFGPQQQGQSRQTEPSTV